jgi:hypothetical protein
VPCVNVIARKTVPWENKLNMWYIISRLYCQSMWRLMPLTRDMERIILVGRSIAYVHACILECTHRPQRESKASILN